MLSKVIDTTSRHTHKNNSASLTPLEFSAHFFFLFALFLSSFMTVPRDLFIQFVEQGLQKGLLPKDITRTLDGEYYLDPTFIQQAIVKHIEKEGSSEQ